MSRTPIIAVIVVLLAAAGAYFYYSRPAPAPAPGPSEEEVLALLGAELFAECLPQGIMGQYRSCEVDILKVEGGWRATVTYDGFYDDSVWAGQVVADIADRGQGWVVMNVSHLQRCWEGRGHQDFSAELCT